MEEPGGLAQHLRRSGFREEPGVVVKNQPDPSVDLSGVEGRVELRADRSLVSDAPGGEPWQREIPVTGVEEIEEDLEKWCAIEIARRLKLVKQPLEREILVSVRFQ